MSAKGKLRITEWGHTAWCPGCGTMHWIPMAGDRNATAPNVWTCNGNHNAPTFHPSLLIRCGNKKVCHSWIQHGQWVFLGDCTHALRNQTVPMRNEEGVGGE